MVDDDVKKRDWSAVRRETVPLPTRVSPETVKRAVADARRAGYTSLRGYLENLIAQGLDPVGAVRVEMHSGGEIPHLEKAVGRDGKSYPASKNGIDKQGESLAAAYPSSAWAFGPGILGNRVVRALEALAERIREGEDMEALRTDLTSVRFEIAQNLLGLRKDYDREVEVRDRRHFARFGTVDE
jgi:hypothetical protein